MIYRCADIDDRECGRDCCRDIIAGLSFLRFVEAPITQRGETAVRCGAGRAPEQLFTPPHRNFFTPPIGKLLSEVSKELCKPKIARSDIRHGFDQASKLYTLVPAFVLVSNFSVSFLGTLRVNVGSIASPSLSQLTILLQCTDQQSC